MSTEELLQACEAVGAKSLIRVPGLERSICWQVLGRPETKFSATAVTEAAKSGALEIANDGKTAKIITISEIKRSEISERRSTAARRASQAKRDAPLTSSETRLLSMIVWDYQNGRVHVPSMFDEGICRSLSVKRMVHSQSVKVPLGTDIWGIYKGYTPSGRGLHALGVQA